MNLSNVMRFSAAEDRAHVVVDQVDMKQDDL